MAEGGRDLTVLVVSQDSAVIEDVRFGFPAGAEIRTAGDAREAGKLLVDFAPSVVVVDLKTGSAGGFALVTDMSHIARLRDVPVLILLEREQDAWLARQAGADLIRTKPVPAESLAADALSLVG